MREDYIKNMHASANNVKMTNKNAKNHDFLQNFNLGRPGWHEGSKNSFGKTFENVLQNLIFLENFENALAFSYVTFENCGSKIG